MRFNDLYSDLLCASTNDHILKEPINLTCSHEICRSCIPKDVNKIVCRICGAKQNITANENNVDACKS